MASKIITICFLVLILPLIACSKTYSDKFVSLVDDVAMGKINLDNMRDQKSNDYQISILSKEELRILRNTIFAKNGYEFEDNDLKIFFSKRKWYQSQSKNVTLSASDKNSINYILKYEDPTKATFSDFITYFKPTTLPLTINDENYGNSYAKFLPKFYAPKYLHSERPTKGLDKIYSSDKFIAVLYRPEWAGVGIYLATFTPAGQLISNKRLISYGGDTAEQSSGIVTIEKDLTVTAREDYSREREINNETTSKFRINENGEVKLISNKIRKMGSSE